MVTRLFALAVLAMALLAPPLQADDTEIYTGYNLEKEVKPNIVFIVDTSKSMAPPMSDLIKYSEYDPMIVYPGACTADKVYWGKNGMIPACDTSQWFYQANNVCKTFNQSEGLLTDRLAMWTGAKWETSLNASDHNRMIECEDDAGKHGEVDGKYYPAKKGKWTSSSWADLDYITSYQLYSANYLNFLNDGGALPADLSRLDVVKRVLKKLLGTVNGINVAIMRFNLPEWSVSVNGGHFVTPMLELNDENRPKIYAAIDALTPVSDTPLAETLYEATRYYMGEAPVFAKGSAAGVISNGKYISPIEYQCQKNFVVLFSDGDPFNDDAADTLIKKQPGFTSFSPAIPDCSFATGKDCLTSQAEYLNRKDLNLKFNDTQNVVTYTIGFEEDMSEAALKLMMAAAQKGSGFYRGTSNAKDITEAFNSIITNILSVNTSFTAPAVSVNAFNRLTYLDHLYFGLFKTSDHVRWDGNIKRYRFGKPTSSSGLAILDADGKDAIDSNTGFFRSTARSWWSADQDGDEVRKGGAASNMPLPRKAYTCCYGSSDLSNGANELSEDNANITAAELGAASEVDRTGLLQWARGVDVNNSDADGSSTDARPQMGDPLHTEPVLVTYGDLGGGKPDLTLFTTTNEGMLHAIDTTTGEEIFSYLPRELLPKVKSIANDGLTGARVYGLDGPMSVWFHDEDYDGTIEPATDHVYLYLTMRRGGNYIYALDVTDRAHPKQIWKIQGGTGAFAELSQTWSKPTLAKVRFTGEEKQVLFFGGGYDETQDDYTIAHKQAANDIVGRAVFMVDAKTGTLLWSAGAHATATLKLPAMTNSIPSEIRAIDTNGDGLIDRLYVADMRSQLWRFDIDKANKTPGEFAKGGIMAKFSAEGTDAGNRRIYYPPSISMSLRGDYLNIALGTGYREHPMDTVIQDRFYVVRDRNVFSPPLDEYGNTKYTVATNFLNATAYVTPDTITPAVKALFETSDGFYIDLKELNGDWIGEKVLAPGITLGGYVIFTTFTPVGDDQAEACAPSQGMAREYVMSVEDSTAYDGSSRAVTMTRSGIPPRPVVITTEDGSAVLIGTNFSRGGGLVDKKPKKIGWRRKQAE